MCFSVVCSVEHFVEISWWRNYEPAFFQLSRHEDLLANKLEVALKFISLTRFEKQWNMMFEYIWLSCKHLSSSHFLRACFSLTFPLNQWQTHTNTNHDLVKNDFVRTWHEIVKRETARFISWNGIAYTSQNILCKNSLHLCFFDTNHPLPPFELFSRQHQMNGFSFEATR